MTRPRKVPATKPNGRAESAEAQGAPVFDPTVFLGATGVGKSLREYQDGEKLFSQADPATAVFYIRKGKVKISVVSTQGKEAVIALLGAGDFFGEGCLAGQPLRMASATAVAESSVLRIEKERMIRLLHDEQTFSQ